MSNSGQPKFMGTFARQGAQDMNTNAGSRIPPDRSPNNHSAARSPTNNYSHSNNDQGFWIEDRPSIDEYPSYGGTPTRGAITPRATPTSVDGVEAPRSSISLIMKGLGLASGRKTSGRLSDADELQPPHFHDMNAGFYDEIRRSNASPLHVPFSLAGNAQIPEGELYYGDVDTAARGRPAEDQTHKDECIDLEMDKLSKDENPPESIYLQFEDVRYRVVVRKAGKCGWSWGMKGAVEKEILHGITGSVGAGEMLAMMGPSGSGKTTLLNVLGGRRTNPQWVSGSILYNDVPYTKNLKRRIGFVTQDDVLYPHLTVKETLTFSALLRLPKRLTKEQKKERAEIVLAQLGLQRCADTVIGNQFLRGVSGGERKRVCIGQEILVNPSLLFLDEPTSGLDSTTALRIIRLLQNLAHQGRAVMATIHQPSSRAFHMFDKLILLSEGYSTYFGKARGSMTYFDSIGFAPLIPMNPADFLLDLCSGNTNDMSMPPTLNHKKKQPPSKKDDPTLASNQPTPSTLLAKDVKKYLVDCCEQQISTWDRTKSLQNQKLQQNLKELQAIVSEKRQWPTSWWEQFLILFVRGFKERRHEYLSWMRVVQMVLSSLLAGCLWWQSKHSTPKHLLDQEGLLFFIGVFWGYFPLFTAIFTFPMERPILSKERATDMYRLSAYFMARTLSDLPIELGLAVCFVIILYYMTNLRHSFLSFLYTTLAVCLDVVASQGVGFFIGAAVMDVQKATTLASVIVLAFMLAGGYFVQHIPPFIGWVKYISFQAHTYKILLIIQHDVAMKQQYWMGGLGKSVFAMVAMVLGYRILAYVALRRMKVSS
eukprot:c19427_g2_i1 orf=309-2771(-)